MATTVTMSVGTRTANSVTVNTVTGTNPYTVTLSAAVPGTCQLGDKLTDSSLVDRYLITGISGSQLTVSKYPWNPSPAPVTGAATLDRAFPTWQAWNDLAPVDLTVASVNGTAGGALWKSAGWNDSEFTPALLLNITGSTTSATCYKWMTAAPTQSFADNTNKLTNALQYNAANGVSFRPTTNFQSGINVQESYARIDRMQIKGPSQPGDSSDGVIRISSSVTAVALVGNILQTSTLWYEPNVNCLFSASNIIANNLILWNGVTAQVHSWAILGTDTAQIHNNTIVVPSDKVAAAGIHANGSTNGVLSNNAIFGFTAATSGTFSGSSHNNATNLATVTGTSSVVSLTYSNQFTGVTSSAPDFRTTASSSLKGAGTREQTYTLDLDVVGSARSLTFPTIGAWEPPTASGSLSATTASSATFLGTASLAQAPRTVTFTAKDETQTPLPNLTGYSWAWFDVAPWDATKPGATDRGTGLSTNGSSVGSITIINSVKLSTQLGYVIISNSNGTTGQSPAARGFVCVAAVD